MSCARSVGQEDRDADTRESEQKAKAASVAAPAERHDFLTVDEGVELVQKLCDIVRDFVREHVAESVARAQLDAATSIEAMLSASEAIARASGGTSALEARIATLEKQMAERIVVNIDAGVFQHGKMYRAGQGVSHGGSFWIAQRDTDARPGAPDSGWRLAVKRGRDANR